MKILLICNIFTSEGCSGTLVLKALQNLGHDVKIWDTKISNEPPKGFFDVSITWTNHYPTVSKIPAKKKVLYYLEDTQYAGLASETLTLEHNKEGYDYVFTVNKIPGFEKEWMPIGADTDIFFPTQSDTFPRMVLFPATCRDDYRKQFAEMLSQRLEPYDIALVLCGNGWDGFHNWVGKALYFEEFNKLLNHFSIVVNVHVGELSPSDKVHCIASVGGPLLLNDDLVGFKECYPDAPVWSNMKELVERIVYFMNHEEERVKIVKEMQDIAINFTYEKRLYEVIKMASGVS